MPMLVAVEGHDAATAAPTAVTDAERRRSRRATQIVKGPPIPKPQLPPDRGLRLRRRRGGQGRQAAADGHHVPRGADGARRRAAHERARLPLLLAGRPHRARGDPDPHRRLRRGLPDADAARLAAHRQGDRQGRARRARSCRRTTRQASDREDNGVLSACAADFSLLEVMVAVALFGAVVTIILSAQGGLVASNKRAANMGQAIELARCRMSELEEKQLKLGYPEIEEKDTSTSAATTRRSTGFTLRLAGRARQAPADDRPRRRRGALVAPRRRARSRRGDRPSPAGDVAAGPGRERPREPRGRRGPRPRRGAAGHRPVAAAARSAAPGAQGLLSMVFSHRLPVAQAAARVGHPPRHRHREVEGGPIDREFALAQYVTNRRARGCSRHARRRRRLAAGTAARRPRRTARRARGARGCAGPAGAPAGGH